MIRKTAVTPRMLRLTVGGEALRGFEAGAVADERVKLFFPPDGEVAPALPVFDATGMHFPEGAPLPHARNYTVRRFDADRLELDLDFVVHGTGRACDWAVRAEPGALLGLAGPAGGMVPAATADLHLFAGDETALPAIATLVERLPEGARALVFVEVADAREEQPLDVPAGTDVEIRWLHRGTGPWRTPTPLERAVRAFGWPDGEVHAWVAGEAAMVRELRRQLRHERRLPRENLHATGYWRLGRTVEQWVQEEGEPRAEDD
ncbi:siderophore-interacting protein [Streptomyces sp. NPDC006385]|uniref:siderophore-interacting protein n=1 Tax=Streptomyces sp. NPDC006385 TaxID=3156761 RepID=UPI0033B17091